LLGLLDWVDGLSWSAERLIGFYLTLNHIKQLLVADHDFLRAFFCPSFRRPPHYNQLRFILFDLVSRYLKSWLIGQWLRRLAPALIYYLFVSNFRSDLISVLYRLSLLGIVEFPVGWLFAIGAHNNLAALAYPS